LKWFSSKSRQNETIGIEFTTEGVAFAHIKRTATQQPTLSHSEFITVDDPAQSAENLRSRLAKLGLQKVPCNIVMNNGSYQMLLGEAPKVPQQ